MLLLNLDLWLSALLHSETNGRSSGCFGQTVWSTPAFDWQLLNQSKLNGQTHKCLLEMNQTGSAWRLREPFQFIKNCCSLLQTTRAPSWPPEGFQQPSNSVWDLLGAFRTFWNSRETTLLTCYGCHAIVSWQYISWTHLVPMFTPAAVVIGMAL